MRVGSTKRNRDEERKRKDDSYFENLIMKSLEKAFEAAMKKAMNEVFSGFQLK